MRKTLVIIVLFFISAGLNAQNEALRGGKTNQVNAKGLKQGLWTKKYKNGKVAYEVFFKNNKPVGEYKRFHYNGELKALLIYNEKGYASAKFYDNRGKLVSEGYYQDKQKDSVWHYYSSNDSLRLVERYSLGKLHGKSFTYFDTGKIARFENFKNGKQAGLWRKLYPSGKLRAEGNFINGLREGATNYYFENGRFDMKGRFKSDKRHGKWKFYSPRGKLVRTVTYDMGKQDAESEKRESDALKKQDENKGKIPDPKKFRNNPMELMRQSRN